MASKSARVGIELGILMALALLSALRSSAQTFPLTLVYNLGNAGGNQTVGTPIQASDGNLYGTTPLGGPYGLGTVFCITPSGVFTTVYITQVATYPKMK